MGQNWLTEQLQFAGQSPEDGARLLSAAEEIAGESATAKGVEAFLKAILPLVAAEFGATGAACVQRQPGWVAVSQYGRISVADLPGPLLAEVLDREQAVRTTLASPAPSELVATPIGRRGAELILVLVGRSLPDDTLSGAALLSRAIAAGLLVQRERGSLSRKVDELRAVLQIASDLSLERETEPLLERIAQEATRLLKCDRASIFIWDREHQQVVARPALGVDGGVLRLSDRTGIVGEVLQSGKLIRVDDAYQDARFSQKVDQSSGYRTRNLLCVPLVGQEGKLIGAFEVLNKLEGMFSVEDEEALVELARQVAIALQRTRERETLIRSQKQLKEQVTKGVVIVGESSAIQALRGTIRRLAETDLPVLVLGESGTGKEVVAQSLHYQGSRAEKPFIAVNCAALAETLLESELFGHEKGAFTDAHDLRRGKFELAEGGTIFLDEIGDMSLGGQAKLLRVLEQRVITRVGGSQNIPINARLVAATNANLAEAVRQKRFREDLYYRLNVVTLDLPALRDRPDDVLALAEYFLSHFAVTARRPKLQLTAEAKKRLQAHSWPGNVRELRNLMERVAFLAPGDKVEAEDLAFILNPEKDTFRDPSPELGLSEATNQFQQEYIRRAIRRVRSNMSEAARLLGLHRSNLYRKMRQLGMTEAAMVEEEFPA